MRPGADGPAPCSGIVLAGGRGTRLGGQKLGLEVAGRPLLHHAILALLALVDEVIVVGPAEGDLAPLPADPTGRMAVTRDVRAGLGPLAGVAAGLAAAGPGWALVVGGDQAALRGELLAGLLAAGGGSTAEAGALVEAGSTAEAGALVEAGSAAEAGSLVEAAVLAVGDGWRPLPCLVRREPALVEARRRLEGPHRSLHGWLQALGPVIVPEAAWRAWDPDGTWQADVDTPDDLARAGRILRTWTGARVGRARS